MAPFVLVAATNEGLGTVSTLAEARSALVELDGVATVAGTAVPGAWFADIDAADTGAEPEAGEAAAEDLAAWCAGYGLPYLVRASGRPGGRHVVVLAPPELLRELRTQARQTAEHHGVAVQLRRTLRLLTAPHRLGLPAPVLDSTLPAELPRRTTKVRTAGPFALVARSARRAQCGNIKRGSRSEREFGDAIGRCRSGWGPGRAWAAANQPGSKAAELGEIGWRRWVWAPACTMVDAEQQVSEPDAWARFRKASRAQAQHLGLDGWRSGHWLPARAEATRERPRRRRVDSTTSRPPRPQEEVEVENAEIALVAAALRAAAEHHLALTGRRPQFAASTVAVLTALATAVVRREGSISVRDLAVHAGRTPKTVRAVLEWAAQRGITYRAANYQGGADDCDAWRPGPETVPHKERLAKTSPTRLETPIAAPAPTACRALLRAQHRRDRATWRLRCQVAAECATTGTAYADATTPASRALRSLWHQRRWWANLTPDQQERRRTARRALIGRMHRSERNAWFGWLGRRGVIAAAAERVGRDRAMPVDHHVLATAPLTLHIGLRDPQWRTGGTPAADRDRAAASQQEALFAA